jgi:hypothetical protein
MKLTHARAIVPDGRSLPRGKWIDARRPSTLKTLDAVSRRQLVACAGRGSTLQFTPEDFYAPDFRKRGGDHGWIGDATECPFEWWDAVDDRGKPLFTIWLYNADCGLVFTHGTTTDVAQAIQFGSAWELSPEWEKDAALQKAFGDAHRAAAKKHPKSDLAQFDPVDDDPALHRMTVS